MIVNRCGDYLEKVKAFAKENGQAESLEKQLKYLDTYASPRKTQCLLFKDFAPQSFEFSLQVWDEKNEGWTTWFQGGLIYHGKHDGHGSGSGPSYAVTLTPTDGWSIHT